jgi:hypothetical protein
VVDRDGLENRCACKRTVGSNPTLSAILATANDSLPELAAEKAQQLQRFGQLSVDRPKADYADLRSLRPFSLWTC